MKVEVATSLGTIGPMVPQAAIPALEKAAKDDESPAVRAVATAALKKSVWQMTLSDAQ